MASNPSHFYKLEHVCGAAGYGAIGDTCSACEADRAAGRRVAALQAQLEMLTKAVTAHGRCRLCGNVKMEHMGDKTIGHRVDCPLLAALSQLKTS